MYQKMSLKFLVFPKNKVNTCKRHFKRKTSKKNSIFANASNLLINWNLGFFLKPFLCLEELEKRNWPLCIMPRPLHRGHFWQCSKCSHFSNIICLFGPFFPYNISNHLNLFCANNRSKKHQIFEKWDNSENQPSCKVYSPCKILPLGKKSKFQKTCQNPFYKSFTVVLCKKPLKKTPNIREMRPLWKSPIMQTL